LVVSPGTFIDPSEFPWGDITNYTVLVPADTISVTLTPTANDGNAAITVNGVGVQSGEASGNITLVGEMTTIPVVVTAEDGTELEYTIVVRRGEEPPVLSDDATLSGLTVSPGGRFVDPDHFPYDDITFYVVFVPAGTTSVTITPTASDGNAAIAVNGVGVPSGEASGPVELIDGAAEITIIVTAENGEGQTEYTIVVREEEPSDT
jgi:hypothetical protein